MATRSQTNAFAVQRALTRSARPTIFDVGAHEGRIAERYLTLFADCVLHCFEPFQESFARLKSKMAGYRSVQVVPLAVGSAVGSALFHSNMSSATNSLLPTHDLGDAVWGGGRVLTKDIGAVDVVTLDWYAEEHGIQTIDILKLDIQGAEFSALQGAQRLLSEGRIKLLYFEVLVAPTYVGQATLAEYFALLESHDYGLVDVYNSIRRGHRVIQMDILFEYRVAYT